MLRKCVRILNIQIIVSLLIFGLGLAQGWPNFSCFALVPRTEGQAQGEEQRGPPPSPLGSERA